MDAQNRIKWVTHDRMRRFLFDWDRYQIGDIVTTDFHEDQRRTPRTVTDKAYERCSHTHIRIWTVTDDNQRLSADSAWFKMLESIEVDEQASLEDFL